MAGYNLYPEELETCTHYTDSKFAKLNSFFLNRNNKSKLPNDIESHTNRVNNVFRPLRITLTFLGRWPFQMQRRRIKINSEIDPTWTVTTVVPNNLNCRNIKKTDFQIYSSSLKSAFWLYFLLTTLFLLVVLLLSVLGFCDFFLDWNFFAESSWDEEEKKNFETNLVPFVLVWSCLMHSSISSVSFLFNRRKVAKFLNYWNVAVDQMDVELPKGIKRYVLMNHLGYLVLLAAAYIAYKILYLKLVRGGAALMGILTFRPFISKLDMERDFYKVRVFGVCTILYAVYASRAFLLIFSFKCKLLQHGFKIWNCRFKKMLQSPKQGYKEEQINCDRIFADYKVLLKLVKLTDKVFGAVLQSYYGSQLINMCFELYYLARSGSFNETTSDIIGALIVLAQNTYIFFAVSLDAAYVNEEAAKGLEILRSHGMSLDDSVFRKYLILNMQIIFSQKIVLTGGKFFSIDRPFIVTVLGAVFTYFIIVLQVGPSLHKKFEGE